MENLFYLFILLALGKISRKLPGFPENMPWLLNQFVVYFSFPSLVLLQTGRLVFKTELAVLIVIPWALVFISVMMVRMISAHLSWDRKLTGGVMLAATLGNTSFLGFPAVVSFFGQDHLAFAIIYDQLGSFLALAVFGTVVVSVYGTKEKISLIQTAKRVVGFPPFAALILGVCVLLMDLSYPPAIIKVLEGLSATLIPLVIFSVGAQLRLRQPLSSIKPIVITIILKMLISPVLAFTILLLMNVRGPVFEISVFEAAMPSMVMSGILAQSGELDSDVANAAIGFGLMLSFITLPLIYSLLKLFS